MAAGRQRRRVYTAIFAAAWLVGLELVTRALLVSPSNVVPDSSVGSLYAPNSQVLIETADAGFVRVRFNELGLNDWPLLPDDHRPRILALGDSYVEAFQVARQLNFLGILGREKREFRFVNGGRSALDPVTEYLMLEKVAPLVHPDGIILFVNPGDRSDMRGDGITLRRCGTGVCDYTVAPLAQPERKGVMRVLSGRSGLATYLVRRFNVPLRARLRRLAQALPHFAAANAAASPANTYRDQDFAALLALVFQRIANRNPLLVVAIPDIEFKAAGKARVEDGGFGRLVCRAAARAGADCLDAAPALIEAYEKTGQPPRGFDFNRPGIGHFNEAGHAALAHAIEKHLTIFAEKVAG